MKTNNPLQAVGTAVRHPAFLFSAGNTALAISQAEPLAIAINVILTLTIFVVRFIEVSRKRSLGVPFSILAGVNFLTAVSVEFNHALGGSGSHLFAVGIEHLNFSDISNALPMAHFHNLLTLNRSILSAHVSALAYVAWGIGHLFAGHHEKANTVAKHPHENPQTYYGIGDMSAVNASGSINLFSFPIMLLGFVKSLFIGRTRQRSTNGFTKFVREEVTAARLFGVGYIVGAITSHSTLHFAIAQVFWSLAYFQFKKDT